MHRFKISITLALAAALAGPALGQGFGNEWLSFENDDARLVSAPALGLADTEEKDYAVGDFDHNGLDDLVVVRKQPNHTTGARPNVLFLNLGGVLTDSTAQYASASDVAGDMGFLTPTNDRDVVATDVDQDGWLDIVTATTLSPGQPKEVSHPRVYRNLGEDVNGDWLGFRYEAARIPQLLLAGGTPSWPRFTAVDAGDVTGDGFPDLYFGDNDNVPAQGGGDMNDRLLVNDGTGFFVDESALRMTNAMLSAAYTTSAYVVDVNLDGENDVVRNRGHGGGISTTYNDPNNAGFFALMDSVGGGSPYYTSVGDLNNDGRPDLVISDNGADRVRYNEATNPNGSVQWSAISTFSFLTGSDDGFGSDSYVVDLDQDGWNDVLICDYDVELAGCTRRLHLYHNAGGMVGGVVTLREEAEMQTGGWRGAVGLNPLDLRGTHDVGVLDIDGDTDLDLVVGKCTGTKVYLNETVPNDPPVGTAYCPCPDASAPCNNPGGAGEGCENSSGAGAALAGAGSDSVAADDLTLDATGLLPNQPALAFVGLNAVNGGNGVSFGDGLRCAGGNVVRLGVKSPDAAGAASWGPGLAAQGGWTAGDLRRFQIWYRDPSGGPCGNGFNLSNGLEVAFTN